MVAHRQAFCPVADQPIDKADRWKGAACPHCGVTLPGFSGSVQVPDGGEKRPVEDRHTWEEVAEILGLDTAKPTEFAQNPRRLVGMIGDYGVQVDLRKGKTDYLTATDDITEIWIKLPDDVPFRNLGYRKPLMLRHSNREPVAPASDAEWDQRFKFKAADPDRFLLVGGRRLASTIESVCGGRWKINRRAFVWSCGDRARGERIEQVVTGVIEAVDQVRA